MENTARYKVLVTRIEPNSLAVDYQRVRALHHSHILVVLMEMRLGGGGLRTSPEGHLRAICSIEYKSLHAWRRLTGHLNLVRGVLHECGEIIHSRELVSHDSAPCWLRPSHLATIVAVH